MLPLSVSVACVPSNNPVQRTVGQACCLTAADLQRYAQGLIMDKKEILKIANTKLLKVTNRPEIVMCKGQCMYLYDIDGNEYFDFIDGWAVNCLGYSPKVISDILTKQSRTFVNTSPSFYN